MPSPQAPPTYSSTQLPSPSVFPSLISEAQRLFLLSLRGAWGLCVSAYAFDNEVATLVKNEAGGGNLSILEWRMAAFWQREAKRHKARRWRFFCVRPGMMKWMRFLLRCIRQTVGRMDKEKKREGRGRGKGLSSICRLPHQASAFPPQQLPPHHSHHAPPPPRKSVFKDWKCATCTLSLFPLSCAICICCRGNTWQNADRNGE